MVRPMKKFLLGELEKELRWPNIVSERRRVEYSGTDRGLHDQFALFGVVRVVPSKSDWPDIRVVCDPSYRTLEQVEFGAWDGHEDDFGHTGEEADGGYDHSIRGTIRFVADLVQRKICVVEELDSTGEVLTAGLFRSDEIPGDLLTTTKVLRRVLFDRKPRFEEIDRCRYVEWKGSLIERGWAKKMGLLDEDPDPTVSRE